MLTKFYSLFTSAALGLKINPYTARGTEKVGQHYCSILYPGKYRVTWLL